MKNILKIAASLLVVFFVTSTAYSLTKNNPKTSTSSNPSGITYVVEVNFTNPGSFCHSYQVVLTNENGVPVTAPIDYNIGITNYVFHENGPVNGTRIAHLERVSSSSSVACNQSVYSSPNAVATNFRNGSTYMFYLSPTITPGLD
jgi:hypothetical protein